MAQKPHFLRTSRSESHQLRAACSSLLPPGGDEQEQAEPLAQKAAAGEERLLGLGLLNIASIMDPYTRRRTCAWEEETPSPSSQSPKKNHPLALLGPPSQLPGPMGKASPDLLDGDGPAAPDAVHLALSSLLLAVQVSTFSRLEERRRGRLAARAGRRADRLEFPALPPYSLLLGSPSRGAAGAAGPGRN